MKSNIVHSTELDEALLCFRSQQTLLLDCDYFDRENVVV